MQHAILCLFFLAGCTSSKPTASTTTSQSPKRQTETSNKSAGPDETNSRTKALPDKVVSLSEETKLAIAPFLADAKASYPGARERYLAGLPANKVFMVTTTLSDKHQRSEHVFIRVNAIREGRVYGTISNKIGKVEGYSMGDPVHFAEDKVRDWVIVSPGGSEEGNRIGRFLDYWRSGEFYGALFGITRSNSNKVSIRYMHMMDRNKQGEKVHFDPPSIFLQAALKELQGRDWQEAPPDKEVFTYMLYWPLDPTNLNREP